MADWSEGMIVQLRALWDEGLSTIQIGLRLGVSKNAVCGKAGRLGLLERPSPIKRDGIVKPRARKVRAGAVTLPSLASIKPAPKPVENREPVKSVLPSQPCQWPMWNDGTPRAQRRFCGDPAVNGPYCPVHRRVAYTRRTDAQEAA